MCSLLVTIAGIEAGKEWSQETLKAPLKNNPDTSEHQLYRLSNQILTDVPKASDFQLKKPALQRLLDHMFSIHTSPQRVMMLTGWPRSPMAKPSPMTSLLGHKLSLAG